MLIPAAAARGQAHHHPRPGPPPASAPATAPAADAKDADKGLSVTYGTVTRDGRPIAYRATAGPLAMRDESGKVQANIFFVAYDNKQDDPSATGRSRSCSTAAPGRPPCGCTWAGPGPKVVQLAGDGRPSGPPYRLVDNPSTWLAGSDLVFVDPVGTGYSRPAAGEDAKQFYGYRQDLASTADFIRTYLTKYHRWGSPIYLAGESYGTTRCAGLAGYLADRYGIEVNGVTLDLQRARLRHDLPLARQRPAVRAVAAQLRRRRLLPPQAQGPVRRRPAADDRRRPRLRHERLPAGAEPGVARCQPERRQHVIDQLAALTGIPADTWDRGNLRLGPAEFEKMLLGDGRHILGRFDGRLVGYDPAGNATHPSFDPSLSYYLPAYESTFNQYVHDVLHYDSDLPYEVLSERVGPWPLGEGDSPALQHRRPAGRSSCNTPGCGCSSSTGCSTWPRRSTRPTTRSGGYNWIQLGHVPACRTCTFQAGT